jgi:hypothetical protein
MKCPGQDTQYWKPGAIFEADCPKCGRKVEFFKDDTSRKCGHCGHRFVNPNMDFGCAAYCQFAEQCIGDLPPELLARKEDLLKDRVAIEMKRYFKTDFAGIGHATRVARHAERIGKREKGNLAVILSAAYLHAIAIPEAEKIYGSPTRGHQEIEGLSVVKSILIKLGAKEELIAEVCNIISQLHHPETPANIDLKVLYDSDLLEELDAKQKEHPMDPQQLEALIDESFMTDSGREMAVDLLLKKSDKEKS